MENSRKMVELWEDGEEKVLDKLRFLDIEGAALIRTLDLRLSPNLETLYLKDCRRLVELRMPTSQNLRSIELNDLKMQILDLRLAPNLKKLCLSWCNHLVELRMPTESLKLTSVGLSDMGKLRILDLSLAPNLEKLSLERCDDLVELRMPTSQNLRSIKLDVLEKLQILDLKGICGLQYLRKLELKGSIPVATKDLDQLECLEELMFSNTKIKNLPDSICMLKHLKSLEITSCLDLEKLPEDIGSLERLEILILRECRLIKDIPNSIGHMKCLKELNITFTNISHLPQSIYGLKGLRIASDRELLESCGLTPKKLRGPPDFFYYILP